MPPIRGTHGFMAVIVEIKGRHRPVVDEGSFFDVPEFAEKRLLIFLVKRRKIVLIATRDDFTMDLPTRRSGR